ncbi:MAG: hypothetical protein U0133_06135 [Gemmatimonadales bacterium]
MSEGIAERDVVRFKASPVGVYRIFCGYRDSLSGMWILGWR